MHRTLDFPVTLYFMNFTGNIDNENGCEVEYNLGPSIVENGCEVEYLLRLVELLFFWTLCHKPDAGTLIMTDGHHMVGPHL